MVCPLCEAVNLLENEECFCCRWAGDFEFDPELIETKLYEMIYRCPELLAVLVEEEEFVKPPTLLDRVRRFFYRFRRRLDIFA